jgi:hypothetical protein
MISQRKLFEIYRGAELPDSTAALAGANAGAMGTRGLLLAQLMQQNKIKAQDLSPQDVALAGQNMDKAHPGESQLGKVLGGAGGFLGNLGGDIWSATKGLAPGIFNAGKAVVYDATHPFTAFGGFGSAGQTQPSHIYRDIVKPQSQYFKEQYGQGNVFNNFYQHPLGPILDLATAASLGAGGIARTGSALSRAGRISPESRLASLGSTEGRAPLIVDREVPEGVAQTEIARDYSARPLRKGIQVATDKLGDKIPALQRGQLWATTNNLLKKGSSIKDSEALQNIQRQVSHLIPELKDLSPEEAQAFDLRVRGINSPEWIAEYENAIKRSQANDLPEELGANATDFGKLVKPELPQSRVALSDTVKNLATGATKSDRLDTAERVYRSLVDERITGDLDPEVATSKANELRDALTSLREGGHGAPAGDSFANMHRIDQSKFSGAADEGVYVDDLMHDQGAPPRDIPQTNTEVPFSEPTIAPSQLARNWEWHEPSRLGKIFGQEEGWRKRQGPFSPSNVTYQNVLQEPFNTYRPNASPLLAGVHRPDLRQFADLIAKHERDVVDQAYSAKVIDQWALKGKDGEPVTVKSAGEAERKYGPQYTAVHPSAPLHYYQDQTTVADMVSFMGEKGFPVDGPEMQAAIRAVGEDTAVKMTQAARRQDAYVMPKSVVEYQRKIENAASPYESKIGRMGAKALNFWRTYTLSLMPRWALNTAVGSFMLNAIKGVGPKNYMLSRKLGKGFSDEEGTMHPSVFESSHAGGVNLGNQVGMELLEPALQAGKMGTNRVARFGMQKVQAIEDYFRRASFVHSVNREAKQALRQNGATIAGFEKDRGPRTIDEYRDLILQNPKLVQKAVDDVNRFAYNFAMLGPMERRYVRQIAPFWGWYKFISGVIYKLPVEYPGRANILSKIGDMGMESNENALGDMPRWLMGNVLGKTGANGILHYLSTTGVNPFSQVFNPASPEGIGGIAQLGQASPIIQGILAGFGVDSMSGGSLPVSPEHGVSPDFSGTLRDEKTGEERPVASVDWQGRVLGTLMRSFPEARIGERVRSGGRAVYPESIPLISEYYMPTKPESRYGSGIIEALEQMTGTAVRPFNIESYQHSRKAGQRYAKRRGTRSRAKLKQQLKK